MTLEAERIVITGVGLASPLGQTLDELWENILEGKTAARSWPDLEAEGHRVATACRIEAVESDPLRRGQLLALNAARAAVKDARLDLPSKTGVYIGSTLGESYAFEKVAEGEKLDLRDFSVESFVRAIQRVFEISGPSQAIATACAAGNYAVGAAVEQLRRGRARVAIAGGVEPFSRLAMVGFSRSRAMARDVCRPFDQHRTGMMLGEGAAVFVLELAADAQARGVRPLVEVAALGLSGDGYHATAPRPDGSGMLRAMKAGLRSAGITEADIDWVNAHGSGTQLSDAAEGRAIRALFGEHPPPVSGSKGALGHALGAAAALELALCVKGVLAQTIPPTPGHEIPDAQLAIECTRQPTAKPIRWVMNNAFAFGGLNSALLLKQWN